MKMNSAGRQGWRSFGGSGSVMHEGCPKQVITLSSGCGQRTLTTGQWLGFKGLEVKKMERSGDEAVALLGRVPCKHMATL